MSKQDFMMLVKELRARTGIGIGKCKDALENASGDIEEAIKNLRKAGLASAVKKEGRETNEGIVAFGQTENGCAVVEVNAETDFVVKNQIFQDFATAVAKQAAATEPKDVATLLTQPWAEDLSLSVDQQRATTVQTLGENIQIKRVLVWKKDANASIGAYSHMGGKIVVMVELTGSADQTELARDIAMHVAAEAPDYLGPEDVPASVLQHEREIAREQVKGKPENIIEQIVEGKVRAYLDGVCLLPQKYVKNPSLTVAQLLQQAEGNLAIKRFIRWSVGEE